MVIKVLFLNLCHYFLQALYELLKCNYNIHEALERYRSKEKSSKGTLACLGYTSLGVFGTQQTEANVFFLSGEMLPWSEEECRNFEHALLLYEKNFHLIQKHKVRQRPSLLGFGTMGFVYQAGYETYLQKNWYFLKSSSFFNH